MDELDIHARGGKAEHDKMVSSLVPLTRPITRRQAKSLDMLKEGELTEEEVRELRKAVNELSG